MTVHDLWHLACCERGFTCHIRKDKNKFCSDEQWRLQQIGLLLVCWSILSDQVVMVYQRRVAKSCSVSAKSDLGCSVHPWFAFWKARDTAALVCCLWCCGCVVSSHYLCSRSYTLIWTTRPKLARTICFRWLHTTCTPQDMAASKQLSRHRLSFPTVVGAGKECRSTFSTRGLVPDTRPTAQQPTELWVGSHMQPSAAAPSSWIIFGLYSFLFTTAKTSMEETIALPFRV